MGSEKFNKLRKSCQQVVPSLGASSYRLLKPLIFSLLDPESAHEKTLGALRRANQMDLLEPNPTWRNSNPVEIMGLTFPNVVGLAAGMDKTAACVEGFGSLGFGHIEVGTLTPRAQSGNPKPRVFRLPSEEALINRLGFNNPGIHEVIANLVGSKFTGILGINIGKNFDTPNERALDDYLESFKAAYPAADYITINLSSPNTEGLRDLQNESPARNLMQWLKVEQTQLAKTHGRYVPLVIKISPDLEDEHIDRLARVFLDHGIDGVIATNTTLDRKAVRTNKLHKEKGGLSGAPVFHRSNEVIRRLNDSLEGRIPIIGVGGIMSMRDVRAKLRAGASLVQVYTGLVYRGPALIREILDSKL